MTKNDSQVSKDLVDKIVRLHDISGLGFRRISKVLKGEGYELNKDKVNRLYLRAKENGCVEQCKPSALERLKTREARAKLRVEDKREREQIRMDVAVLFVEEHTMTFEQRKELFTDQKKLLRFAKRVLPITGPQLWDELCQFCEERNYDLADALAQSLGVQAVYESQSAGSNPKRFDVYMRENISKYLASLRRQEQREKETNVTPDRETSSGETKTVVIELRDDFSRQSTYDSENYVSIEIDRPDNYFL